MWVGESSQSYHCIIKFRNVSYFCIMDVAVTNLKVSQFEIQILNIIYMYNKSFPLLDLFYRTNSVLTIKKIFSLI